MSKEVSEALVSQITKGFGIDVNIIFGDIDIGQILVVVATPEV